MISNLITSDVMKLLKFCFWLLFRVQIVYLICLHYFQMILLSSLLLPPLIQVVIGADPYGMTINEVFPDNMRPFIETKLNKHPTPGYKDLKGYRFYIMEFNARALAR